MDNVRRQALRELIQILQGVHIQVHHYWIEEEAAFEGGPSLAKETALGGVSIDAVECLERAADGIHEAIGLLQEAVGDDPISRRSGYG